MICEFYRDIQERFFASSAMMCNCRLNEMPCTVELVHIFEIGKAIFFSLKHKIGVQVAVGLLCICNLLNHSVELGI